MMNWTFSKRGLARDSIESVLGRKISYVLPYAENEFIDALNRGIPAIIYHKGKPLAGILEDLAYNLSKPEHQNTPPDPCKYNVEKNQFQEKNCCERVEHMLIHQTQKPRRH